MKERAVLIIHGFGGNEQEILFLHNYLRENKIDSFWIQLSGHNGNRKSFSKATCQDWLKDVNSKVAELSEIYKQVTCIGFSMGGLLAIHASENKVVDQLVLCSTPIYLYNPAVIMSNLLDGFFSGNKNIRDYYFDSVTTTSFKACLQFLKLLHLTKKRLKVENNVKSSLMILQNKRDETSHYRSADFLWLYTGKKGSVRLYNNGNHQLFLSENKEKAVEEILLFIVGLEETNVFRQNITVSGI
ncbi:alpha/beta fold hydrolase [Enterococcus sp. BWB1-3]|uniref:alpha/beta hydrolase n=1 Tax=unclassified Enterococcus TaxID=2608891 RepID=UPI001923A4CD|nr:MULTISPECIES: alpha/beta fold hydrolase [unclassified Enterococcus]MBL1229001.1 alpha/beta fold hydrolase [Enterococcus sp. BWB1-3]MCB5955501.1 alpha/beta fold hydrolase [Enterococcus sp. CWB-B31]